MIILTAPSGAGKSSIAKYLLDRHPSLAFSVSATTRDRREYETDGVHYHFLGLERFQQSIERNEFIEWEMVYEGVYYGTLRSEIEDKWLQGKIPVLDIDVKGAIHVKSLFPKQSLSIFIEPPSIDELKIRLESRGTETAETLRTRVNKASYELSFKNRFDISIMNIDLPAACIATENAINDFLSGGLIPGEQ